MSKGPESCMANGKLRSSRALLTSGLELSVSWGYLFLDKESKTTSLHSLSLLQLSNLVHIKFSQDPSLLHAVT